MLCLTHKSSFRTYYSYPIQTSINLEFNPIGFPAISVCNMNPVKRSKVENDTTFKQILKEVR